MQSNENRIRKKQRKQTDRRQSSASSGPAPLARPHADRTYTILNCTYLKFRSVAHPPRAMKWNKIKLGRHTAGPEKIKIEIKNKRIFQREWGRRMQCLRLSFDAVRNKNMRFTSMYICGGIDWNWICVGRGVQESKVNAKTVIGFARGAPTPPPHRSQLNFVCTCVAGD